MVRPAQPARHDRRVAELAHPAAPHAGGDRDRPARAGRGRGPRRAGVRRAAAPLIYRRRRDDRRPAAVGGPDELLDRRPRRPRRRVRDHRRPARSRRTSSSGSPTTSCAWWRCSTPTATSTTSAAWRPVVHDLEHGDEVAGAHPRRRPPHAARPGRHERDARPVPGGPRPAAARAASTAWTTASR